MKKEQYQFTFTLQRAERRKKLNYARLPTVRHEFDHAITIDVLDLPMSELDANPQSNTVWGITKSGGNDRRKLAIAAAASVAGGHNGTGGDRSNMSRAADVIAPSAAIGVAKNILHSVNPEEHEIAVEKLDFEYNGRLTGNGQLRKLMRDAAFERKQLAKERQLFGRQNSHREDVHATRDIVSFPTKKQSGEIKLAKYESLFNPFSDN